MAKWKERNLGRGRTSPRRISRGKGPKEGRENREEGPRAKKTKEDEERGKGRGVPRSRGDRGKKEERR